MRERPVLKECLNYLRKGDTLVVYKFERDLIHERTQAGREEVKKKGVVMGRKKGCSIKSDKVDVCYALYKQDIDLKVIMRQFGIKSKSTVYRYLRMRGIAPSHRPDMVKKQIK